ncbi:fasciclin-like arabinogalactan protein 6 [Phtheirospermum japonicum]|uniref:Fasciclin-like arabinogalactan protein 6 n=1 Tax=Phtheirospermum japonicum TaxID=374723 RepID=A0A830D3L4_9LAMI|nr:fasciclin-like arabinogalactan protein 6 [Phtheirospermum japonicum]
MAAPPRSSLIFLLSLGTVLSCLLPAAPAPINVTGILEKAGQYNVFIRLLTDSQADDQINNQVNNSYDGLTVFAPTDDAFNNLPAGALNSLTGLQLVQLVLYHICPRFYSLQDFRKVSNPARTQATGQGGRIFGLYFNGQANQVDVSTGIVEVPVYNALRKDFPLALYQVDTVLLPREFYEARPPPVRRRDGGGGIGIAPSTGNPSGNGGPASAPSTGNPAGNGGPAAAAPSTDNHVWNGGPAAAPSPGNGTRRGGGGDGIAPSTGNPTTGNGGGKMSVGLGLVAGFWWLCMGLLAS